MGCKNSDNIDALYLIFTVNEMYSVSSIRSSRNLAIKPTCAMLKLHMQEVSHALPSQTFQENFQFILRHIYFLN